MSLLIREGKDGRRKAGYLVYLLGGLVALAGIALLHRRFGAGGISAAARRVARGADVAAITQPASTISPVNVEGGAARRPPSYRLDSPPALPARGAGTKAAPSADAFNPIHAALTEASQPADDAPGQGPPPVPLDSAGEAPQPVVVSGYPKLPPALSSGDAKGDHAQLLGYRDPSADPGAGADAAPLRASAEGTPDIVPRGTLIFAYLLTAVDTGNPSAVLQFAAARTLVRHGHPVLDFGTRFLGRLAGEAVRDRLNLSVDTILWPDGRELGVKATAVEADETGANIRPGVEAYYFPPPAWAQVAPYVSDAVTGFLGLLESRAEQPLTVSVGGVGVQTAAASDNPRAPLYQASGAAVQDFTQARLKEIEQRYASYYLIPAGTACWLQLESDLDLRSVRSASLEPPSGPAANRGSVAGVADPGMPASARPAAGDPGTNTPSNRQP